MKQEFVLATKQRDATGQRRALEGCKAQAQFPVELLESMAALCMQNSDASSSSLSLAQDALKAALLKRLQNLTPDTTSMAAQVSIGIATLILNFPDVCRIYVMFG